MKTNSVLFVTNCYYKDWEYLKNDGFMYKYLLNDYPFKARWMIINNVDHPEVIKWIFNELADRVLIAADECDAALAKFNLTEDCFTDPKTGVDGAIYSIDSLIELAQADGFDYICHYCGDVELEHKGDWISEGIEKIEAGYFGARPGLPESELTPESELSQTETQVFSDHAYLISVKDTILHLSEIMSLTEPSMADIHVEYGGESFERKMSRFLHATNRKLAIINSAREIHEIDPRYL